MQDSNAAQLLAKVMHWQDTDTVAAHIPELQLLADYKYDHYQRFAPGQRFIESLALWLEQFEVGDRIAALELVREHLIFLSDTELSHLVHTAYPDLIVQERLRLVAEELAIEPFRVGKIATHQRFEELRMKSLYLGLSDGARTNELRRASGGEIGNEQIWQAYELGEQKSEEMQKALAEALTAANITDAAPRFNLVWLLDDFSASGNTYIRYHNGEFKGKIKKVYQQLHSGDFVDPSHHEVFLLLYVATRQAIDHIEYWSGRFTSERGYKPLQVRTLFLLESDVSLKNSATPRVAALLKKAQYFDERIARDKHIQVGGTDGRLGFADCALPVVLSHNTPNNSVYLLWGYENYNFVGLFPRMSRHRDL